MTLTVFRNTPQRPILWALSFLISYFSFLISPAQPLAFPGAEGFGKFTVGGRGGRVIAVTNLNDDGPGSLRDAVSQQGARTVIFRISGTIELLSPLRINNDSITIAGQTAPGDGICLKDYPLVVNASEVIVRYMRVRVGDKMARDYDALSGGRYGQHHVVLDHVSVSYSIDECLSIYKTRDMTVQWCLVSHSLSRSRHTKGAHGFGGIWGGYNATFHHNLLANHSSRNPRFSSVEGTKNVDYRNNVVYNWGFKSAYGGGRHGEINMVANYYKPGPASQHHRLLDVADDGTGRYYLEANVMEGDDAVSRDNWSAVGGKKPDSCHADKPFAFMPITPHNAREAYEAVVASVGCSHRRDSYDREVIRQMTAGTATWGRNGIIDTPEEAGGWPVLQQAPAPQDTDGDGMPDAWEQAHGLNSDDATDGILCTLNPDYTNLEVWINSLTSPNSFKLLPTPSNSYEDLRVLFG